MKEFVPKKTLTVQLPVEIAEKFEMLCKSINVPRSKMIENLINKVWSENDEKQSQ